MASAPIVNMNMKWGDSLSIVVTATKSLSAKGKTLDNHYAAKEHSYINGKGEPSCSAKDANHRSALPESGVA